ncbi:hypothetical protein CLV51_103675 [Chitinophaga niastensis]|uniref:Membrane or secreted protein n=1 Tax=Chitinophaga niastensis TaxID=536980 RepID=A0A2P8HKE9_CHINA|nr:membrane or secreted protein [Chitinophaga niastensis]PSL46694.1 hypothetical protein CLV51_103675 [Chitinophaga niastensis]
MKKLSIIFTLLLSFLGVLKAQNSPVGAWKAVSGETTSILLISPSWFTVTDFSDKNFIASYGGTWKAADGGETAVHITFNTANPSQAGQDATVPVGLENGHLITSAPGGGKQEWTRLDDGTGTLAGNWQMTAKEQDGKMNPITPGATQTFKMLSGTRFQWVVINVENGEFSDTGGGSYTFENGTYTEKIDFFSKDNARIGLALSFKGKVDGNNWDNNGLSPKGDVIHEVWSRP